jgi:hypothetical protein
MIKKFTEGQWVKLIGGTRKMRVVKYFKKGKVVGKSAFSAGKWVETEELTGQVQCVWVDNDQEFYGEYAESNLEATEV